jgi:membrane associated rhomboid family serine protease
MFIPLYDGVPLRYLKGAWVTWSIIAVNVVAWLALSSGKLGPEARIDLAFGVIPSVLLGEARLGPGLAHIAPKWTVLTSMFLHGSFWHLAGNMLFLWVFGDNVEDAMGRVRFLIFYVLCGIGAVAVYVLMAPFSDEPLIGASGAISGVIMAYLMLYPRVHVWGLVFNFLPLTVPAWLCVGLWIVLQIGSALFGGAPEVGWWAHIGGLITGAALVPLFKRREVRLFSPQTG